MKTRILEHLQTLKSQSNMSLNTIHEQTGFAVTTLSRWMSGAGAPDIYDLTTLVETMGGSMTDLFADVGKQEMQSTQTIEYQGAVAMQEHYETRLAAAQEKCDMLQAHHEQAIRTQQEAFDRSLSYLNAQIHEMKAERTILQERSASLTARLADLDHRRHHVFWGMLAALLVSSSCLVIFLFIFFLR